MPHISMHESYNASISAISNSFHKIIAVRSVSAILILLTSRDKVTLISEEIKSLALGVLRLCLSEGISK